MDKNKTLAIVLFEDKKEEADKLRKIVDEMKGVIMTICVWQTLLDASMFFGMAMEISHCSAVDEGAESDLEVLQRDTVGIKTGSIKLGILTDLYMPSRHGGGTKDPVGVAIAVAAKSNGFPVVVCTSGLHPHSHWAESILDLLNIPVVRDKDWWKAIELLKQQI